jgi:hypothetical protein
MSILEHEKTDSTMPFTGGCYDHLRYADVRSAEKRYAKPYSALCL